MYLELVSLGPSPKRRHLSQEYLFLRWCSFVVEFVFQRRGRFWRTETKQKALKNWAAVEGDILDPDKMCTGSKEWCHELQNKRKYREYMS